MSATSKRLLDFVSSVRAAGCEVAIVHARKAVLGGLSPKENREVPPLRYDVVRRLKQACPALPVIVNGGLRDARAVLEALSWCDGVMLGREAYHRPWLLAELQQRLIRRHAPLPDRASAAGAHGGYAQRELAAGERLSPSPATCSGSVRASPARATSGARSAKGARRRRRCRPRAGRSGCRGARAHSPG